MIKKILVNISNYQRQQIDELVDRGIVSTVSEAVRLGLMMFVKREKLNLWDKQFFTEYEAGILVRNHRTGVLLSAHFQRDLNSLVKEKESRLRGGVWVILRKIVHHFDSNKFSDTIKDPSLEIKPLELENYYLARFIFCNQPWHILLRYHQQDTIACHISCATDQLWFE